MLLDRSQEIHNSCLHSCSQFTLNDISYSRWTLINRVATGYPVTADYWNEVVEVIAKLRQTSTLVNDKDWVQGFCQALMLHRNHINIAG